MDLSNAMNYANEIKKNADKLPGTFIGVYIENLKKALDELQLEEVEKMAKILLEAYDNGKHVYLMGNGGSAATASHITQDLAKGTIWPIAPTGKRFRVACLSDNVPLLTAWTNDIDYSQVFREQLLNLIGNGDIVIGISGSGNSMNVVKAIEYANSCGATTICLTGCGGGMLKDIAQECIIVNSNNMERVEDVHLVIGHIIKVYLNLNLNLRGLK